MNEQLKHTSYTARHTIVLAGVIDLLGNFIVHLRARSAFHEPMCRRFPSYLLVVRFRWGKFEGSLGGLYARLYVCGGSVCGRICVIAKASCESESEGRVESSVGGLWGRRLR